MHYYTIETFPFGENTHILYDEKTKEAMVIDPGGSFDSIEHFITNKSLKVKYVTLTHAHVDHIAALKDVLDKYKDAKLILAESEKDVLKSPIKNLSSRFEVNLDSFDVDMYVNDADSVKLGENKVEFIITPGHTKGSMCILADKLLFTGDTLFAGSIGRTDLPTGSYDEIMLSLMKLSKMDDDIVVLPGHGGSSTLGFEKKSNPFMRGI